MVNSKIQLEKVNISDIYQFGDQVALDKEISVRGVLKELELYKDQWSQYNPRKSHIKRYGLSVLNHSGEIGPGPDLDSLTEYNQIHQTQFKEKDFNKATPLYTNSKHLPSFFDGILPYCVRMHFLKLQPGGFFPAHRDHTFGKQDSFRMIVPIKNCNPPSFCFMLENKALYWEEGWLYVVNTTKQHYLFNPSGNHDSLWLVINVQLCKASVEYVISNLSEK